MKPLIKSLLLWLFLFSNIYAQNIEYICVSENGDQYRLIFTDDHPLFYKPKKRHPMRMTVVTQDDKQISMSYQVDGWHNTKEWVMQFDKVKYVLDITYIYSMYGLFEKKRGGGFHESALKYRRTSNVYCACSLSEGA